MEQKGNDDEGILGFLADDIYKEIKRGRRLVRYFYSNFLFKILTLSTFYNLLGKINYYF